MANEIYNTTWWGTALDTARTAGTDPDFFGSQMKLLTSEQDDLVTNGDFSNGLTNWIVDDGTSWTNVNNTAFCDGNNGLIKQGFTSVLNKTYKVTFDVVNIGSGELGVRLGSGVYAWNNYPSGSYVKYLVSGSNLSQGVLFYAINGWSGSIDNVSVQAVRCDLDPYGPELVTNGDFATDSNWNKGGGATISGRQANIVGNGSTFVSITQNSIFTSGKKYKVSVDVTINSGLGLKFQDGATNENIGFATTSGTYVFYFTGTSNPSFVIGRRTGGTAFNSSVENVSVKEVQDHVEAKKCLADWIHRTALKDLNN